MVNSIIVLVDANRDAKVNRIEAFYLSGFYPDNHFFFCGSVVDKRGHIIGIPNKYPHILDIDPTTNKIDQWGNVKISKSKGWTGGCLARDGIIYGFPRGANSFLKIDSNNKQITYRKLSKKYNEEHHYGGILNDKGVIYQPPKNSNRLLVYDIKENIDQEIAIQSIFQRKRLFYGGALDLNGNGYFFPAGKFSRVCMVDDLGNVKLIGKHFNNAFFNSGTLASDGNVYGFSSYKKGIIQIDTERKTTNILLHSLDGGYFGAKMGFNGKIYSVPGNSDFVLEFDINSKMITNKIPLPDCEIGATAKCAGGAIDRQGNIWCVPAMGHYIYKICFDGIKEVPSDELYRSPYFRSFY